ncbi:condensation domain-containing protein, partial [Nocardia amamiensis]|uniref:condensation domain-containing protein n=1 Tax=Nocardia amamiensis TaxID=404578 RepID=UPI002B4B11B4
MLATQLVSRVGAAIDARVPVREVFEASTVGALAARAAGRAGEGGRLTLGMRERPARVPLSFAQQRMWFIDQFDTASAVYNMPLALRLSGELDVAALQAAVADVLDRHEVLRTVYPSDETGPVQVVVPVEAVGVDLSPVAVAEAELMQRVGQVLGAGFDVAAAVPVRARLLRVGDQEHVLAVAVHHIAADGSSMRPLARDVMAA